MATPTPLPSPVARPDLLAAVDAALSGPGRVVLSGPAGVGKSTLLGRSTCARDGDLLLAAYPAGPTRPYATLAELFAEADPDLVERLSPPRRAAVAALLRLAEPPASGMDPVGLRLGLRDLMRLLAERHRLWFVIDPADRADGASLEVLADLWRRLPEGRGLVLLSARDPEPALRAAGAGAREVRVPLWSPAEIRELLAPLRLPHRHESQVCRLGGGLPRLAERLGAALAAGHRIPQPPAAIAAEFLTGLSPRARHTALHAAVATRPTEALLRRAGRDAAHHDLVEAARLGLCELGDGGEVGFHAEAIRDALVAKASARTVRQVHDRLAGLTADLVAAVRHRALAAAGPSAELAGELDTAVARAQHRGEANLAAELALLAVDLTPATEPAAVTRRLLTACRHAGSAGRVDWVERAARAVCEQSQDPDDRLRARMAVIDAVGQDFGKVKETFAAAEAEARSSGGADPGLHAELVLWMAWRTYVCDTDLPEVLSLANRAARLAEHGADPVVRMQALTMVARTRRFMGLPGDAAMLSEAEALVSPPVRDIAGCAGFARARHALFDDALGPARDGFTGLLAAAERQGELKGLIEVLRGLAEVELRAGNCRAAREYIVRAMGHLTGSDLSPSPIWYVAALVETHAGDRDRATVLARQGLASAREDDDVIFTIRNRYVLGLLRLYAGQADAAATSLTEAADLDERCGVADPSILPLHGDLAEALAHAGRPEAALPVLTKARRAAQRLDRPNVLPRLDLAEAAYRIAVKDHRAAAELLGRARTGFTHYGLELERGRTLLAEASLARRLRKRAQARDLLTEAETLFAACDAEPWRTQAETARARLEHPATAPAAALSALTPAENRVVRLVADGATNRQVASMLDVSVKTVEASLTRIYRKLGVQTRVQLAQYRHAAPPPH